MNLKKKNNDSEVERLASIEKSSSIYETATQLQKEYIIEDSKKNLTRFIDEIVEDYNDICKNQSLIFEIDWNDEEVFNEFHTTITYIVVYYALLEPSENINVLYKISETSRLEETFKWFIPLNELQNELDKLRLIYSNFNEHLFKLHIFNYIKTNISLVIFKKVKVYGENSHTDQLSSFIDNYKVRRRKSPNTINKHKKTAQKFINVFSKKENRTSKKKNLKKIINKNKGNEIDFFLNPFMNIYSSIAEKNINIKSNKAIITDLISGKSYTFMRLLPIEELTDTSQRQLYINLYPLFKFILVGEINVVLLSENEYEDLDDATKNKNSNLNNNRPYDNFEQYKLKTVMSILGKT